MPESRPGQPLDLVLTTAARTLIDAQVAMDACYTERAQILGEEDLPPVAWKWGRYVLSLPVAMDVIPKITPAGVNRTFVSPHKDERSGQLSLIIRHTPGAHEGAF